MSHARTAGKHAAPAAQLDPVWHVLTKRPVAPDETEYRAASVAKAIHACALLWGVGPSRLRAHPVKDCPTKCAPRRKSHAVECVERTVGPCVCGLKSFDVMLVKVQAEMTAEVTVRARTKKEAQERALELIAAKESELLGPVSTEADPVEGCMALLPGEDVGDFWESEGTDGDPRIVTIMETM
jgi:hypothetical protein